MELVRFGCFLLVLVLAKSAAGSAATCDCEGLKHLKVSEKTCLLNQLLHIIGHLVSCSQKPGINAESYNKLLEATKCKEAHEVSAYLPTTTEEPPPPTTTHKNHKPTLPIFNFLNPFGKKPSTSYNLFGRTETTTVEPQTTTEDNSSSESSEESSEKLPTFFNLFSSATSSPLFPITLLPQLKRVTSEDTEEDSSSEDDSSEETTTQSPHYQLSETTETPKEQTTFEPDIFTNTPNYYSLFTSRPQPHRPEPTPITVFPHEYFVTEPPATTEAPTVPPNYFVRQPEDEPVCSANSNSDDDPDDENGVSFQAETFFIPVLKFHGAPSMSAQELKDYLFRCLPSKRQHKKKI